MSTKDYTPPLAGMIRIQCPLCGAELTGWNYDKAICEDCDVELAHPVFTSIYRAGMLSCEHQMREHIVEYKPIYDTHAT